MSRPAITSRRILVLADTFSRARAHAEENDLAKRGRVSLVTALSHPGQIAGIAFDEVHDLTTEPLNERLSAALKRCTRHLKEQTE